MDFVHISEAIKKGSGKVAIRGWVYRERKLKDKVFLVIRDATNIIQCIVSNENIAWEDANKLLIESSVEIEGILEILGFMNTKVQLFKVLKPRVDPHCLR